MSDQESSSRQNLNPALDADSHHDGDSFGSVTVAGKDSLPATETTPGVEDQAAVPSRPAKSAGKAVREIVETLLLALVIFVAVRALVLNFRVDGSSMSPNLQNKEMLLVNRNVYFHFDLNKYLDIIPFVDRDGKDIVYPFHPPERGDIIVFNPPDSVNSEKPYIKRVIALAGETVEIKSDGYVYIDGKKLDEPYIKGAITECNRNPCAPYTVPEGMIYVMGDNRRNSSDSRIFQGVKIENIIGKAWLTYWPFDDFGLVPHFDYPDMPEN
jgi:signal peptidase I